MYTTYRAFPWRHPVRATVAYPAPMEKATLFADLTQESEIPDEGTLSRVLYKDDDIRVVLFGFDAGQELTEHTAALPAVVQILSGLATVGYGEETVTAGPGCWLRMEAHLPHSVFAIEPTVLLLTLLKQ